MKYILRHMIRIDKNGMSVKNLFMKIYRLA